MILLAAVLAVVVPFLPTHQNGHAARVRPAIGENGSDFITYRFPGNETTSIAFTPDGNAFAITRGGILKIAPDGTESYVPGYGPSLRTTEATKGTQSSTGGSVFGDDIVYSSGYLWFNGYHGIVRVHPDGTAHRYYQLGRVKNGFDDAGPLIASPDGIYFLASRNEPNYPYYALPVIGHINNKFELTVNPVASTLGYGYPKLVWSPDNHLDYIGFVQINNYPIQSSTNTTFMYQLEADGSSTLLGTSGTCAPEGNAVVALGAIFFPGSKLVGNDATDAGNSICRATIHGRIGPITPLTQNPTSAIAVDAQADVWSTSLFGPGIASYNLVSKTVSSPVNPPGAALSSEYLYTGPDQNIYFFGGYGPNQTLFGAYVRHQMIVTPNSINLNAFDNASIEFFVTEPVKGGAPWTARSLDPTVATVSPASSLVGRFHVNEAHAGTTTLVVTDALGNVSYLPVTAN